MNSFGCIYTYCLFYFYFLFLSSRREKDNMCRQFLIGFITSIRSEAIAFGLCAWLTSGNHKTLYSSIKLHIQKNIRNPFSLFSIYTHIPETNMLLSTILLTISHYHFWRRSLSYQRGKIFECIPWERISNYSIR